MATAFSGERKDGEDSYVDGLTRFWECLFIMKTYSCPLFAGIVAILMASASDGITADLTAGRTGAAPSGRAILIFKPNIQYPRAAQRLGITGSGIVVISVTSSGRVSDARMGKSTGSPILDNAVTSGFRSARFIPGTVPTVKIPITFTPTGAQF